MSAHYTRGPWKYGVKLTASENHRGFFIYDSGAHTVADVMPRHSDGVEGKANARLIAESPALLNALITIVSARDGTKQRIAADLDIAINIARSVVARATGEAQ